MPIRERATSFGQSFRSTWKPVVNAKTAAKTKPVSIKRMMSAWYGPTASEKLRTNTGVMPHTMVVKASAARALDWVDCILFECLFAVDPSITEQRLSGMFATDSVGDMRYIIAFAFWALSMPAFSADVEDMVKAGQSALSRMDIPLAMTHFDNALKAVPSHRQAAYERGRILLKMGDAKNAVGDFTTAVLADQKFGLAYVRRGEAHMVLSNPQAAFKDFDAAISASPELAEVFVVRATYRFKIGNLLGAKEDVQSALAVADDSQKPALQKMLLRMQ